jgi:hypothetical protein
MSYDINPCKACWHKYKNGLCNVNELNDCVVNTATAFSNFPSNNSLRGNLKGKNWQDCIAQRLAELPNVAGKQRSFCNFQVNTATRWLQVPHHYPQLLEQTKDPKTALKLCHKMCKGDRLSESCKETCDCDHNAVENFSKNIKSPECDKRGLNSAGIPSFNSGGCMKRSANTIEKFSSKDSDDKPSPKQPTFGDKASAHPFSFWVIFSIVAILLALVLLGFGITLFSNKTTRR